MKTNTITRREAIARTSAGALAVMSPISLTGSFSRGSDTLALRGGTPVRSTPWPGWPVWNPEAEPGILDMLRSGRWWRGNGEHVVEFEKRYAGLIGTQRCLATASGTAALSIALHVLDVDAGDEVLVSPYTFIATYNVIFDIKALPVFVDTDPETFLLDPAAVESRITGRSRAILPVHIYGLPVDMDRINATAKKHGLAVIEDACQAWLAEYKGKKAGALGDLGCFSFQNSKHLPAGEGGAITGNDERIMDRCHSYHNCGRPYGSVAPTSDYPVRGGNLRMQQVQALILMSQLPRLEPDTELRAQNAAYLSERLREIPGIEPVKLVPGADRAVYHLYPFRYLAGHFNDAPREKFMEALTREGVPCSGGYGPQNRDGLIEEALSSRGYRRLFPAKRLKQWREENRLPGNDRLCREAVCLGQNMLLGSRKDMDDIVEAVRKIHEHRDQLL
jgi:perosamine synthetase